MSFLLGIISDFIYFKITTTVATVNDKTFNLAHVLTFTLLTFLMSLLSLLHISQIMPSWLTHSFTIFMQLFRFFCVVLFCMGIKKSSFRQAMWAAFLAESVVFSIRILSGGIHVLLLIFRISLNPDVLITPLTLLMMLVVIITKKQLVILFDAIQRSTKLKATLMTIWFYFTLDLCSSCR